MARRRSQRRRFAIDEAQLAAFRAGLRRRYTDEEILAEIGRTAERLGRSPTMQEFADDPRAVVHPQTVVARFGSWNRAKRAAGLAPRRFATREDLVTQLRALGDELGRAPTVRDLEERRGTIASKSLYWHVFGSLSNALVEAGFAVPDDAERLEDAVKRGAALARTLGRLPRFADWTEARDSDPSLPSEWQVYRLVGGGRGSWAAFQLRVRDRVVEEGGAVASDGALTRKGREGAGTRVSTRRAEASSRARARRDASGKTGARRARGRTGGASR